MEHVKMEKLANRFKFKIFDVMFLYYEYLPESDQNEKTLHALLRFVYYHPGVFTASKIINAAKENKKSVYDFLHSIDHRERLSEANENFKTAVYNELKPIYDFIDRILTSIQKRFSRS